MSNRLVASRRKGGVAPISGHAQRQAAPEPAQPTHNAGFPMARHARTASTWLPMRPFGTLEALGARLSPYNSHRPAKRQAV
jgi:hypothetical protein